MPRQPAPTDLEAIAAAIGPTPRYDEAGNLTPIGKPERKVRYYVVWAGRATGIFMNWGLTSSLTSGYSGAAYKKYTTLKEAREGWEEGPQVWKGRWRPPRKPADTTQEKAASMPAYPPSRDQSPVRDPSTCEFRSSPFPVSVALPRNEVEPPLSDEECDYWAEDVSAPPSPDSASFISGSLTPGTLSPGTITTPLIPTPALARMSISSPRTPDHRPALLQPSASPVQSPLSPRRDSISRSISCGPTPSRRREPSPIKRSAPQKPRRAVMQAEAERTAAPSVAGALLRGATSSRAKTSFEPAPVKVPGTKEVFVVVRGDFPGVYLDRNTAMIKLGTSPGMKLVRFESRSVAGMYFAQEYMAGRVGVPVAVLQDD